MSKSRHGSTQLAQVDQCARLWALSKQYVSKTEPDYRSRGSALHEALAYHWASQLAVPPDWYLSRTLSEALDEWPQHKAEAGHMLRAYRTQYGPTDRDWVPVSVEHEYEWTSPGGAVVTAKPDLVVRSADGSCWLVDHKSGRVGSSSFRFSWQLAYYVWVVRHTQPIRGVLLQTIQKKKAGVYAFGRKPVALSQSMYIHMAELLERRLAREAELDGVPWQDLPWSPSPMTCQHRFGECDFIDVCDSQAPLTVLEKGYRHA